MAVDRLNQLSLHLSKGVLALSPNDVVITMAIRSPLCKAKKGGFKDTRTDELMLEMFKQSISHSNIDPAIVGDICVGTVLTPDSGYLARSAALAAGFPESVPVQIINRFCSSGLMAVTTIANQIRCGQIDVGLAIGIESMSEKCVHPKWLLLYHSNIFFESPDKGAPTQAEEIAAHTSARDCPKPVGWTSENVASDYGITREDMDDFAAKSAQRAEHAEKAGYFMHEIVPFTAFKKDPVTGNRTKIVITKDDGIRYGTTKESLLKIRSAFPQWGKGFTTGGNASQISDGAAAVMLMSRRKADELGLKVMGKHVSTAVAGAPPRVMGIGPVYAIPMVLKNVGITQDDVDLFEINEAFASQCVYCIRQLGIDAEKVNTSGGAIALGHPLGCTGVRQIVTGLNELERRKGKVLVTSMCVGTGMGAAGVFVRD